MENKGRHKRKRRGGRKFNPQKLRGRKREEWFAAERKADDARALLKGWMTYAEFEAKWGSI